jgi:hypothetical protein
MLPLLTQHISDPHGLGSMASCDVASNISHTLADIVRHVTQRISDPRGLSYTTPYDEASNIIRAWQILLLLAASLNTF